MILLDIVAASSLFLGALVAVTGAVGVLRMPDFYTRAHCSGKGDTLAQLLIFLGLALYTVAHAGSLSVNTPAVVVRLLLITGFIIVTSPTATHAVARGAQQDGRVPWRKGEPRR
ncbi:MAG: monovalent cation/H(+) antiporter subunit G [Planctomycetes bacterium]|nr:monovalent cation/H(+) antiporter subunit G [Planctomycetota bacterium]